MLSFYSNTWDGPRTPACLMSYLEKHSDLPGGTHSIVSYSATEYQFYYGKIHDWVEGFVINKFFVAGNYKTCVLFADSTDCILFPSWSIF